MRFHPARHWGLYIAGAQLLNAVDLFWRGRLRLRRRELEKIRRIPPGSGLILAANHADEMDIKVCLELSRRTRRRFTYMMNAEAFEEWHGVAGWLLARLGSFSVERGGRDLVAQRYAEEVVRNGKNVLVMFPEGEIYYLNDLVQPFKVGAVRLGLETLAETREKRPDWSVYIVPVALKYRYRRSIGAVLDKEIRRMERHLFRRESFVSFQEKLIRIMAKLIKPRPLLDKTQAVSVQLAQLKEKVVAARAATLSKMESKYPGISSEPKARLRDQAQKMISKLRSELAGKPPGVRYDIRQDIHELKQSIQRAGWQPQYIDLDPSEERLAETVMKLEREVFGIKRPRALGNREVIVRIGEPIDLASHIEAYIEDPSATSHRLAEKLRDDIQKLIERT